jgi:hypothetical protein
MKSFAMLISQPVDQETGERRFFIDGQRVTAAEYSKLAYNAKRCDTFRSYQFANRFHIRSVIYV